MSLALCTHAGKLGRHLGPHVELLESLPQRFLGGLEWNDSSLYVLEIKRFAAVWNPNGRREALET